MDGMVPLKKIYKKFCVKDIFTTEALIEGL